MESCPSLQVLPIVNRVLPIDASIAHIVNRAFTIVAGAAQRQQSTAHIVNGVLPIANGVLPIVASAAHRQ
jgi:hypothetical protein